MNMFKFQDEIWTKLEQVEFEQVHEHVHEQNLNKLNLNKFMNMFYEQNLNKLDLNKFMNMFMDKLNSAVNTWKKKRGK